MALITEPRAGSVPVLRYLMSYRATSVVSTSQVMYRRVHGPFRRFLYPFVKYSRRCVEDLRHSIGFV